MEEFENKQKAGIWSGGYVEEHNAYVERNSMVQGSNIQGSSSDPGENVTPYPQGQRTISGWALKYSLIPGMGIQTTFTFSCPVIISGYKMKIIAVVNPLNYKDRDFWATAVKKIDGKPDVMYTLTQSEGEYIVGTGSVYIGECILDLPQTGNVQVELIIGFNVNTGTGHASGSDTITIYPFV